MPPRLPQDADMEFPPEEAARRRDDVIRRMANTPPQPHVSRKAKAAEESAADPGLPRPPCGSGASAAPKAKDQKGAV